MFRVCIIAAGMGFFKSSNVKLLNNSELVRDGFNSNLGGIFSNQFLRGEGWGIKLPHLV